MEQWGLPIGAALLALVTACALLLGRKAERGVARFREDEHESFVGRDERP